MRKLALILATTALFGMAAPVFAVEAGTAAQARTPVAHANVNGTVHAKAGTNAMAKKTNTKSSDRSGFAPGRNAVSNAQ